MRPLFLLIALMGSMSIGRVSAQTVITAGSVTGYISACQGTASASPNLQQFNVSGTGLTGNVTATAPAGFQVSLSPTGGFGGSVTLVPSGSVINSEVVYVRSAASAAVGTISGNIVLTGGGATGQTVGVTGVINTVPTMSQAPNQVVSNGATTTAVNFTGSASSFTWVNNTPGIGLAASGVGNIGAFTAINTGNTPIVATITVTNENAGFAYIGEPNSVSVINTGTQTVVGSIPTGDQSFYMWQTPDGALLYVTQELTGNLSVINTATETVTSTFPVGNEPMGIVGSPDGSTLYVADDQGNAVSVVNTGTQTVTATIPVGLSPGPICISPDGSKVYVGNMQAGSVSVISTATNTVTATIAVGGSPQGIAVSPDGTKVYVANAASNTLSVISTATNTVTATIPVGSGPGALTISADGSTVYTANQNANTISVVNTTSGTVTATISVGQLPNGISLSPDGSELYVTNSASGNVTVINTATRSVMTTIPVGPNDQSVGNFVSSGGCPSAPMTFTITVNPTIVTIGAVTGSISACVGSASAAPAIEQFSVSGTGLIGDVTATAPAGFEVSLSATGGFGSSVALVPTGGVITNEVVYVRSAASDVVPGTISGNVTLTGGGTAEQNVAVTGVINFVPILNQASNQVVTNGASTVAANFTGTGQSYMYTWTNNTPGIGLAASGTGDIAPFTAINTSSTPIVATITVTDPNAGLAFIGEPNSVDVINTTSQSVVGSIATGGNQSYGMWMTPDGSQLFVANKGSNTITDIYALTQADLGTIPVGGSPVGVVGTQTQAFSGNLYVTDQSDNTVTVVNWGNQTVTATIPVGSAPGPICISPDWSKVYVSNTQSGSISVINTATNTVTATITVGGQPEGIGVSPDGTKVYVVNATNNTLSVISTATNTVTATIPLSGGPYALTISADGSTIYTANQNSNTISVISTASGTVTATIPAGQAPNGISLSPDGSTLYVTNGSSGNVSVINTASNSVVATIPVGANDQSFGSFISSGWLCPSLPMTFTITINPNMNVTPGAVTGNIAACVGMASASPAVEQFSVSGWGLTGSVTATAPAGFDISLTPGGGYGSSVILVPSGGALSSEVVYVRSAAYDLAGAILGNVVLTGGGVPDQNVAVTGVVSPIPAVDQPSSQVVLNGASTAAVNFTGTGNTFTWTNDTQGIGLAASGTGNIAVFTAINTGSIPIVATITVTAQNAGFDCPSQPMSFTITVNPTLPILLASGNLLPLTTVYGSPSSADTFTISGTYLTSGMMVTPPAGFEVSSDGNTFGGTASIGSTATVAPTTIYIRLAAVTPVGSYSGNNVISSTGADNANVAIPLSTVTPAPLTIIANDTSRPYGQANPVFTFSFSGWVNNETETQLVVAPVGVTDATPASPVGVYVITPSGAEDANYTFTYEAGTLKITPASGDISVPNAFTPNGDGKNDTWGIRNLAGYPNCKVSVFNRWGQKVFASLGYSTPWDGRQNGTDVPTGSYVYFIDLGNGSKAMTGTVMVIR